MFPSYNGITILTAIIAISMSQKCCAEPGIPQPTAQEMKALEEFRKIAKDIAYLDYQKEEWYLLNWLRAAGMNLDNAKRRLEQSVVWRREKFIDSIINDPEMHKMSKTLKYTLDTVDLHGHPVLDYSGGRWNIRKLVLSGKLDAVVRYWTFLWEMGMKKIRDINAIGNGNNISSFVNLLDVTGYGLQTHACLACLPVYASVVPLYELNYSAFVHANVVTNGKFRTLAPRAFDVLLNFVKPFISPIMAKSLTILTVNPVEKKAFLDKLINETQLRRVHGGKRNSKF